MLNCFLLFGLLVGVDREKSPLDWSARIKIALGAARGLAYLHEDSSPHVIHRDFKSSNILLENDFTPKVSDFGLARTAADEDNRHISTRVMGTFGYTVFLPEISVVFANEFCFYLFVVFKVQCIINYCFINHTLIFYCNEINRWNKIIVVTDIIGKRHVNQSQIINFVDFLRICK